MTLLEFLLFLFIEKKKKRNFIYHVKWYVLKICSYTPSASAIFEGFALGAHGS